MEVLLHREHQRLVLWNAFYFVTPLPRNLHRRLHSLSSRVHGKDHVEPEQLGGILCEAWKHIVVECAAAESQSRRLLSEGLDELRVAMALIHGAVCGEEVEVVLVFWVPYRAAACSRENLGRLATVRIRQDTEGTYQLVTGGSCGQRIRAHHGRPLGTMRHGTLKDQGCP